jgi:hypothetical protein
VPRIRMSVAAPLTLYIHKSIINAARKLVVTIKEKTLIITVSSAGRKKSRRCHL